eukprot:TRINITY_DN7207_c0_g1_i12.p1 TRINITY_DN7207_c0_g1~~TRINITY_DN7207_c0_g1_i12.p1  ORF type:complete len:1058 (+),score=137.33 TRINITY_DN7207_c0_g1_i12:121-3294(+)
MSAENGPQRRGTGGSVSSKTRNLNSNLNSNSSTHSNTHSNSKSNLNSNHSTHYPYAKRSGSLLRMHIGSVRDSLTALDAPDFDRLERDGPFDGPSDSPSANLSHNVHDYAHMPIDADSDRSSVFLSDFLTRFVPSSKDFDQVVDRWRLRFKEADMIRGYDYACCLRLTGRLRVFSLIYALASLFYGLTSYVSGFFSTLVLCCLGLGLGICISLVTFQPRFMKRNWKHVTICLYYLTSCQVIFSRPEENNKDPSTFLAIIIMIFLGIGKTRFDHMVAHTMIILGAYTWCLYLYLEVNIFLRAAVPIYVVALSVICASYFAEKYEMRYFYRTEEIEKYELAQEQQRLRLVYLLNSLYPSHVATALHTNKASESPFFFSNKATVMWIKIHNMESAFQKNSAPYVQKFLNRLHTAIANVLKTEGADKVRVTGCTCIAISGLFGENEKASALKVCKAAMAIQAMFEKNTYGTNGFPLRASVGIGTGLLYGSILDCSRRSFEVFGPAMKSARRCCKFGDTQLVLVSGSTKELIQDCLDTVSVAYYDAEGVFGLMGERKLPGDVVVHKAPGLPSKLDLASLKNTSTQMSFSSSTILHTSRYDAKQRLKDFEQYRKEEAQIAQDLSIVLTAQSERIHVSKLYELSQFVSCLVWGLLEAHLFSRNGLDGFQNSGFLLFLRFMVVLPIHFLMSASPYGHVSGRRFHISWFPYLPIVSAALYGLYTVGKLWYLVYNDQETLNTTDLSFVLCEVFIWQCLMASSPSLKSALKNVMNVFGGVNIFVCYTVFWEQFGFSSMMIAAVMGFAYSLISTAFLWKHIKTISSVMELELKTRHIQQKVIQCITDDHEVLESILAGVLPRHILEMNDENACFDLELIQRAIIVVVDVQGFHKFTANMPPSDSLRLINDVFITLDDHAKQHGLEPIRVIGDTYFFLQNPSNGPCNFHQALRFAMAAHNSMSDVQGEDSSHPELTIGIDVGQCYFGILGRGNFQMDVWGPSVDTAWRLQKSAPRGNTLISQRLWSELSGSIEFTMEPFQKVAGEDSYRVLNDYDVWRVFLSHAEWATPQ